ncbi:hypothetical protein BHM03_00040052 [Ensete ventricosum]|nr:hypothetical protein BHM03_00040052 [Ensete ventricosum]
MCWHEETVDNKWIATPRVGVTAFGRGCSSYVKKILQIEHSEGSLMRLRREDGSSPNQNRIASICNKGCAITVELTTSVMDNMGNAYRGIDWVAWMTDDYCITNQGGGCAINRVGIEHDGPKEKR